MGILFLLFVFFFLLLLITMCLNVFLLEFILPGTLHASQTWLAILLLMLGKFSAIISSNIFFGSFSISFWHPYNVYVGAFNVVPEVS